MKRIADSQVTLPEGFAVSLGLKTYTQEVKTPQGTRIRVRLGPYGDRAEAEKVLANVRKAGLGGAVLTL